MEQNEEVTEHRIAQRVKRGTRICSHVEIGICLRCVRGYPEPARLTYKPFTALHMLLNDDGSLTREFPRFTVHGVR